MATPYTQIWPDAAAGTMNESQVDSRLALFVRGTSPSLALEKIWSHDGSSTGTALHNTSPPLVIVMRASGRADGDWSPISSYGPVIDPTGKAATAARDLWFWLVDWDGSARWRTTIYSGGADASGYGESGGQGRSFVAFLFT